MKYYLFGAHSLFRNKWYSKDKVDKCFIYKITFWLSAAAFLILSSEVGENSNVTA